MSIRGVLDGLVAVQAAVAVTAPRALAVRRVYRFHPVPGMAIEAPCFANEVSATAWDPVWGSPVALRLTVHTRLFVARVGAGDDDLLADLVAALVDDYLRRLDADPTLGGQALAIENVRGHTPTLPLLLEHGGQGYLGAVLYVDVVTPRG
jgi:hypothetical protein